MTNRLSIESVKAVFLQIINSDQYQPGMSGIYDLTQADLSEMDSDAIETLSVELEQMARGRTGKAKVALVSANEYNLCSLQLFKELYEDGQTDFKLFRSLREARQWVASP